MVFAPCEMETKPHKNRLTDKETQYSSLTEHRFLCLEDSSSLAQSHGPTHLPRVVLWHLNHLGNSKAHVQVTEH